MYGNILLATSDGVRILYQNAVNIQLHVTTAGSGDNHSILGNLVGDFGSLGALKFGDAVNSKVAAGTGNILIDGNTILVNLGIEPVASNTVGISSLGGILYIQGCFCISLGNSETVKIVGQSRIQEQFLIVPNEGERTIVGTLVGQSESCTNHVAAVK